MPPTGEGFILTNIRQKKQIFSISVLKWNPSSVLMKPWISSVRVQVTSLLLKLAWAS